MDHGFIFMTKHLFITLKCKTLQT